MKKHFDFYTKFILSVIAVCLIALVFINLKIVPKTFANEGPTIENKKNVFIKQDSLEIGWCDVQKKVIFNSDKAITTGDFQNFYNKFKCPEGYFMIGLTQEMVTSEAFFHSLLVTEIVYAKPCIIKTETE